jgi:hypothetical protein
LPQFKLIGEDEEESAKVMKYFWMIVDGVWLDCLLGSAFLFLFFNVNLNI